MNRELATIRIRFAFFIATLIPLAALALPWVTLGGIEEPLSGVDMVALAVTPARTYLYTVSALQSTVLFVGPIAVAAVSILIIDSYRKRKSAFWAPPAMLAVALVVSYGAADLVASTESGLLLIIAISILLSLHQGAIRIQMALLRRGRMPTVYRALSVAAGSGRYQWREQLDNSRVLPVLAAALIGLAIASGLYWQQHPDFEVGSPQEFADELLQLSPQTNAEATEEHAIRTQVEAVDNVESTEEHAVRTQVKAVDTVWSLELKVHAGINAERALHGRAPLMWEEELAAVARAHSQEPIV